MKAIGLMTMIPEKSPQDLLKFKEECTSLIFKLLRCYLYELKKLKRENQTLYILESFYDLMKRDNPLTLKYLQSSCYFHI